MPTYIGSDHVDLGVSVLSSLRGRHVDDFAGSSLDNDVSVLSQSGTLHARHNQPMHPHMKSPLSLGEHRKERDLDDSRVGGGSTGTGGLEGFVMFLVRHFAVEYELCTL